MFGEAGGAPLTAEEYRHGVLRAELCRVAQRYSWQHGPLIVDALLAEFDITKPPMKESA